MIRGQWSVRASYADRLLELLSLFRPNLLIKSCSFAALKRRSSTVAILHVAASVSLRLERRLLCADACLAQKLIDLEPIDLEPMHNAQQGVKAYQG